MPSFSSSGGGGGYDYVQPGEPTDAVEGEEWYDTDADAAFVYTGTAWVEQTVTDHGQLSGVSPANHHAKPSGGTGLSFNSTNNEFDALLGNALATDANGNIDVQEGNISHDNLSGAPSSTNNQRTTTGRISGANFPTVSFQNQNTMKYDSGVLLNGYFEEIQLTEYADAGDSYSIEYHDGTQQTGSLAASETKWVSTYPGKYLIGISHDLVRCTVSGVNEVVTESHSHSL